MKSVIASLCIDGLKYGHENMYQQRANILIDSAIKFTPFDVLMVTNVPEAFKKHENNKRVIIKDLKTTFPSEPLKICNQFNFGIKRLPIKLCSEMDYDVINFNDCDCFYNGWDQESFASMLSEKFDVWYLQYHPEHCIKNKMNNNLYTAMKQKIEKMGDLIYDKLLLATLPAETRIVFKNNDKLKVMLDYWEKFSKKCVETNCGTFQENVFFTMSAVHAGMIQHNVNPKFKFAKFCRLIHGHPPLNILDYHNQVCGEEDNENTLRQNLGI